MGQSVFSQLKRSTMRPFVAIAFILGSVYGAPSNLLPAGYAAGHLAAAPVAVAHAAPVAVAHAAPVAVAAAPAVSLPAPYSVDTQAEGVTTVHQPAPVVTKQVHYGQTSYVSGYNTAIHKPPPPPSPHPGPHCPQGNPHRQRPHCQDPDPDPHRQRSRLQGADRRGPPRRPC